MKTLVIGHRGTGKTRLLKRLETYFKSVGQDVATIDLDAWIESKHQKTVAELFSTRGEHVFREIEKQALATIEKEEDPKGRRLFVSAGAGFEGPVSDGWRVLWVRRPTDNVGRIFTDRPRLNPNVTPLAEYQERYPSRENRYRKLAHDVLTISEGFENTNDVEADFFLDRVSNLGGALTLMPESFQHGEAHLAEFLEARLKWGVGLIEIRDDLLNMGQIKTALKYLPVERALLSYRSKQAAKRTIELLSIEGLKWDWPVEWGKCPHGKPTIYSLHRVTDEVPDALALLDGFAAEGSRLKAALPIDDFASLETGHRWQAADPEKRSFLPTSKNGRWAWYRLLSKFRMPLNFFREGDGSSPDQPTLLQWHKLKAPFAEFAAVLGQPVHHSLTPAEQNEFFSKKGLPVFSIEISPEEWANGALAFLQTLGLRYAAVTSPLKEAAFASCGDLTPAASRIKAVNTLAWDGQRKVWRGENTDIEGMRIAFDRQLGPLAKEPVAIWGGGGVLNAVRELLPQARCFSVRTGRDRSEEALEADQLQWKPQAVVWAIGRSRWNDRSSHWPPEHWKPSIVVDLNYADDSPGREYAMKIGARYLSGMEIFRSQAEKQREFWGQ